MAENIKEGESRKDAFRRLAHEHKLISEDFFRDPRGFILIKREGIDKIISKRKLVVEFEEVIMERDRVVVKCKATRPDGHSCEDYGEADSELNLVGGGKKFPVSMAVKRGKSRAVLQVAGFYEQGIFGVEEMDN